MSFDFGRCPRCKEFRMNRHNCRCVRFLCWLDDLQDNPDEAQEIYALDHESAAEAIANKWFESEMSPKDMTVWVQRFDEEQQHEYFVEARPTVEFYATEIGG